MEDVLASVPAEGQQPLGGGPQDVQRGEVMGAGHTGDLQFGETEAAQPPVEEENCNRTASLRPFDTKREADEAVANIKARGRLIVGLDIGSNLFSFRDPITGEITGFDVDIAGEIARDIFGTPSQVEYRILSSADRIAALQNNEVDVVVKTMTITCERKKLVNFSTVYLTADQRIVSPHETDSQ